MITAGLALLEVLEPMAGIRLAEFCFSICDAPALDVNHGWMCTCLFRKDADLSTWSVEVKVWVR